jgi:cation diffusion facilitator CzcD-associated flavoprotein CzcO
MTADVDVRPGDRVVVIGTGGAARAAVVAVGRLGCEVVVVGRRPDAAKSLAELAVEAGAGEGRGLDLADEAERRRGRRLGQDRGERHVGRDGRAITCRRGSRRLSRARSPTTWCTPRR